MIALGVAPWIPDVRESPIFLIPGFVWKALPLAVAVLMLGGVLFWGLSRGRPALVVYGGVALMAVLLIAGVRLSSQAMRMTQDFRVVAAALERHARGGDMRLFSASLLLPVDFYAGRQLVRMQTPPELHQYLARPERPLVLVDQRYWRDFQGEFPPDLRVLEKIRIQDQDLFIVRREPSG